MITTTETRVKYLESLFGKGELRKGEFAISCPFCVNAKGKKKLCIRVSDFLNHCWVCGWKARSIISVMKKLGCTTAQIADYVENFSNSKFITDDVEIIEKSVILPHDFKLVVEQNSDIQRIKILDYLSKRNRKVSEHMMWRHRIGYSNQVQFKDRVIIPSYGKDGNVNYYTSRSIANKWPTYVNCDYEKKDIVFGESYADYTKPLVLVEGPFDLIGCAYRNAVALLGSTLHEEYLLFDRILENNTPVTLLLDNDMQQKMQNISKKLTSYGIECKTAKLVSKDPGCATQAEIDDVLENAKLWNWHDNFMMKLNYSTTGTFGL